MAKIEGGVPPIDPLYKNTDRKKQPEERVEDAKSAQEDSVDISPEALEKAKRLEVLNKQLASLEIMHEEDSKDNEVRLLMEQVKAQIRELEDGTK